MGTLARARKVTNCPGAAAIPKPGHWTLHPHSALPSTFHGHTPFPTHLSVAPGNHTPILHACHFKRVMEMESHSIELSEMGFRHSAPSLETHPSCCVSVIRAFPSWAVPPGVDTKQPPGPQVSWDVSSFGLLLIKLL